MAAAAESKEDIEAYDPVAMMLNFAVTNNLLSKDHVQYLALKLELEIATGDRQRGTKMIGEYAALRKFNESRMPYLITRLNQRLLACSFGPQTQNRASCSESHP